MAKLAVITREPTFTKYDEDNYVLRVGRSDARKLIKFLRSCDKKDPQKGLGGEELLKKISSDLEDEWNEVANYVGGNWGNHVMQFEDTTPAHETA